MDRFKSSIEVHASAQDCYNQWHKFEEFPRFMDHVRKVTRQNGNRYHWVVDGPMGRKLEWDAEIDGDETGKVISWHTVSHPDVGVQGAVRFDEIEPNRCQVTCTIQYEPPAGALGEIVAHVFSNPQKMVEEDLKNFKHLMEGTDRPAERVPEDLRQHRNVSHPDITPEDVRSGGQAGMAAAGTAGISGSANVGDISAALDYDENEFEDDYGYAGPYGLEEEEYYASQAEITRERDLDEATLPGIRREEEPYLGMEGALPSEDLIDMRADEDMIVVEEVDVYTESMDIYGEDLESFTEDIDEDVDTALTSGETLASYQTPKDNGSPVNPERSADTGAQSPQDRKEQ